MCSYNQIFHYIFAYLSVYYAKWVPMFCFCNVKLTVLLILYLLFVMFFLAVQDLFFCSSVTAGISWWMKFNFFHAIIFAWDQIIVNLDTCIMYNVCAYHIFSLLFYDNSTLYFYWFLFSTQICFCYERMLCCYLFTDIKWQGKFCRNIMLCLTSDKMKYMQ